ncbi:TetR family transcriptional regulator protein [Hyella patelloides LEGE 07179]|uniref:TetR family transcriptional regulator protein n=1 Tax=Hyella patelloides LEGE 07179 TaxID=945734 RepID=A0A563VTX8_9CYAN|nr:TetR/AcrR family transcriptional regulator [Hyella patelloides]VEP14829.1 TetR family transcriptional regulator protein [Hyella patelloides LEGE 07179]
MPTPRKSTKARLIEAALDLFAERGVTETTTKAVAERAQVNEVTLFRNFGNKYRLLLAVIEDSAVFAKLVHALIEQANAKDNVADFLKEYAQESLHLLNKAPDLVRSIVGEAGNYPVENRLALGKGLSEANRYVAEYLEKAIAKEGLTSDLTSEQIVNLLNFLLLGYFVIESSTEDYTYWDEQHDFLDSMIELFLQGSFTSSEATPRVSKTSGIKAELSEIADLPASLVRSLFLKAKKTGKQEYALIYVLFGAGLSVEEILHLERSHLLIEPPQHILHINQGTKRQVPLNQWVMGFRYGSKSSNPLIQWLKSRQDDCTAIFINEASDAITEVAITEVELQAIWQELTIDILTPQGETPLIEQARQTWCVEMLTRGIELEDLSILSGIEIQQLQHYAQRARNKAALETAVRLDRQKSS